MVLKHDFAFSQVAHIEKLAQQCQQSKDQPPIALLANPSYSSRFASRLVVVAALCFASVQLCTPNGATSAQQCKRAAHLAALRFRLEMRTIPLAGPRGWVLAGHA